MIIRNLNFKLAFLLTAFVIIITLPAVASGNKEIEPSNTEDTKNIQQLVEEILIDYKGALLTKETALAIHEAFRDAGLRGGPELDGALKAAGIDPDLLKDLAPAPQAENARLTDSQDSSGVIFSSLEKDFGSDNFTLLSSAVDGKGELLSQYKCEQKEDGIEKSIPLNWENIPDETKSLTIVMYHFPNDNDHSHVNSYLLLWGINPSVNEISYGMADQGDWYMGSNKDGNAISYTSPCSQGPGLHKYTIALFALSETPVNLPVYSTSDIKFESFMSAVENTTIIGKAELNFIDNRE